MSLSSGEIVRFPGVYRRVKENSDLLISRMGQQDTTALFETGMGVNKEILRKRLEIWIRKVSENAPVETNASIDALSLFYYKTYADKLS